MSVDAATTATINPGDLVLFVAASASNQSPTSVGCYVASTSNPCGLSWDGKSPGLAMAGMTPGFSNGSGSPQDDGRMDNSPIRARTWTSYATSSIASGSKFSVFFRGAVGAKSVTVVVIPGAEVSAALAFGSANGTGTAISPGATPSLTTGQLVLAANFISGGGSDTYTEDAGFTFLHQTSAGAWPAIRVAYKLTVGSGPVSYTLTEGSSRTWISSYQVAR